MTTSPLRLAVNDLLDAAGLQYPHTVLVRIVASQADVRPQLSEAEILSLTKLETMTTLNGRVAELAKRAKDHGLTVVERTVFTLSPTGFNGAASITLALC